MLIIHKSFASILFFLQPFRDAIPVVQALRYSFCGQGKISDFFFFKDKCSKCAVLKGVRGLIACTCTSFSAWSLMLFNLYVDFFIPPNPDVEVHSDIPFSQPARRVDRSYKRPYYCRVYFKKHPYGGGRGRWVKVRHHSHHPSNQRLLIAEFILKRKWLRTRKVAKSKTSLTSSSQSEIAHCCVYSKRHPYG